MTVAVVGAGAAGLRATMLLEQAGINVRLFEGRDRIGGKVHTISDGEAVFDAGGEWIDSDHYRCLSMLQEFGIEPDRSSGWPKRVIYAGQECREDALWSDALEDDIRIESMVKELCQNLNVSPWKNIERRDLDHKTVDEFLREHALSDRGYWWATANIRSDEGDDLRNIGLLGWLCCHIHYLNREVDAVSAYRIPGGMARLTDSMATTLRAKPHLGANLERVRQESNQVCLQFDSFEITADRAILAIPPRPLERVVFDPSMPVAKRCAIEACGMGHAIKIVWQFDRAFWREEGWSGSLLCDGPLQQVWEGSRGEAPILSAYICGSTTKYWLNEPDPIAASLDELTTMLPKAADHFVKGWLCDWVSDPYTFGAFSYCPTGYALDHMQFIGAPCGRVHFAGEHTALWVGFIEGALESAERVVQEILSA